MGARTVYCTGNYYRNTHCIYSKLFDTVLANFALSSYFQKCYLSSTFSGVILPGENILL